MRRLLNKPLATLRAGRLPFAPFGASAWTVASGCHMPRRSCASERPASFFEIIVGYRKAMRSVVRPWAVGAGVVLLAAGCGAPESRSRLEDQSRRVAPVPACVLQLPARRAASAGTVRKLNEEQIVKLVFPSFDEQKRSLPQGAKSCTGTPVFEAPVFRNAKVLRGDAWPFVEQEGDVVYGSGGDGLKLVWIRTHDFPDHTYAGTLAVMRASERFAEVFAVGPYRGAPEHTALSTVRIGGEYLVTATEDGCTGRKPGASCQTTMRVFWPRMGKLVSVAEVPLERIGYFGRAERGTLGILEYRLTSVPEFREGAIKIVEQARVKDDSGHDVRKAEHERIVTLDDTGAGKTAEPSLWDQMVEKDAPAQVRPAK